MNRTVLLAIALHGAEALVAAQLSGVVRDQSGAPVAGATVRIVLPGGGSRIGAVLAQTRTGPNGDFSWSLPREASGIIRVSAPGFASFELPLPDLQTQPIWIDLAPESVYSSVTVSATPTARGAQEDVLESPHVAVVRSDAQLHEQALPTLGHLLAQEPGIQLQQSTYAQVSPTLRGLTGYQVLNLVDGIRFNNSTYRSGP
ncbi:MAG: carboxypeptidase regulatory-like domain-containing protein, partial [Bryobacteraceae bacterium]|nr:carboxypeptidase regulatory-like domain-containing protein [Bryobacteraceae bacterium]